MGDLEILLVSLTMIITALHCITVPLTEPIAVSNVPNPTYEAAELYNSLPNRYLQDIYGLWELKTAQKRKKAKPQIEICGFHSGCEAS